MTVGEVTSRYPEQVPCPNLCDEGIVDVAISRSGELTVQRQCPVCRGEGTLDSAPIERVYEMAVEDGDEETMALCDLAAKGDEEGWARVRFLDAEAAADYDPDDYQPPVRCVW